MNKRSNNNKQVYENTHEYMNSNSNSRLTNDANYKETESYMYNRELIIILHSAGDFELLRENTEINVTEEEAKEIKGYKGSVSDYFVKKSPKIHVAGRVFFHLVESKKEDFPFAFLATYAAETIENGKSCYSL